MGITFSWNNPNTAEYLPEFTNIYRSDTAFEADDLPAVFAVLPGAAMSYTDTTALDDHTYYYRVSFKIGIKEEVSRLIEIKAPTDPQLYSTVGSTSVFPYSNIQANTFFDHAFVADSFTSPKWPILTGAVATYGRWMNMSYKGPDGLLFRLGAMAAIQRFRRNVWLTEGFTVVALSTFHPGFSTSSTEGFLNGSQSMIPVGSFLTWQEAFMLIGKTQSCLDIALNVINALKDDICGSLTTLRGRPPVTYSVGIAVSAWHQYICQLGGYRGLANPIRGNGNRYMDSGNGHSGVTAMADKYAVETDPLTTILVISALCREFPEIEQAIRVWGQETSLTYKDPSDNVVDFLSTGNNSRDRADCLQSMLVPTTTAGGANSLSARQRNINGNFNFYNDMIAVSEQSNFQDAVAATWHNIGGFFKTNTSNGKEFATVFANAYNGAIAPFAVGHIWNRTSMVTDYFTEGLSGTDPLESSVLLRYLPDVANGLVNASGPATIQVPSSAVWELDNHYDASLVSSGFPDPALAVRGTDTTGLPTLLTDIDMLGYIRSGTSFTIEMFLTSKHNVSAVWNNAAMSLIELGCYNSGFRYDGVISHFGDMAFAIRRHSSHTNNGTAEYTSGMYNKGYFSNSWTQHAANNGSDFNYHVVLQYDAINNRMEFFVNGVLIRHYTPFTPAAGVIGRLAFFGCAVAPDNVTDQRHYAQTGYMANEFLTHEIVVTLAKRYNYGCFIGKVPFARKRFAV